MNEPASPAPRGSEKARRMTRAAARHAIPFLLWLGVMLLAQLMHLTPSSGTEETPSLDLLSDASLYAIKTALAALALLILRPWHFYGPTSARRLLLGALCGVAVFWLWTFPESDTFRALLPNAATFYETWLVRPFGALRDAAEAEAARAAYAPSATGLPLFLCHLIGSGLVIAAAEEFFWRGYLMRAARTPDFLDLDVGAFHALSFLAVAAVFGFEHHEVFAGVLTGVLYGALLLKTRDIWCAISAHAVTNLLLGLYVPWSGHWHFW